MAHTKVSYCGWLRNHQLIGVLSMFVPFLGFNPHSWVSTILLVVQDFASTVCSQDQCKSHEDHWNQKQFFSRPASFMGMSSRPGTFAYPNITYQLALGLAGLNYDVRTRDLPVLSLTLILVTVTWLLHSYGSQCLLNLR